MDCRAYGKFRYYSSLPSNGVRHTDHFVWNPRQIIRSGINFFVVAQKKHERQAFILDKIDDRIEK